MVLDGTLDNYIGVVEAPLAIECILSGYFTKVGSFNGQFDYIYVFERTIDWGKTT